MQYKAQFVILHVSERYKTSASGHVGEAISETNGWHSSVNSGWFPNGAGGMLRAYSGGIFSHYTHGGLSASYDAGHYIRAVVVQGEGF